MKNKNKQSYSHSELIELGYVFQTFKNVDVYRLIQVLPMYGLNVDIYFPKSNKGNTSILKTTDLDYSIDPDLKNLRCIVTNLDNYSESETVYESFDEDKYILKALYKDNLIIPRSSKVVVKDIKGRGYKTFATVDSVAVTTPERVNGYISIQVELTPFHLTQDSIQLKEDIEKVLDRKDMGEIYPDVVVREKDQKKKIKKVKTFEENEDLIEIDLDGGYYND